MCYERGFFTTMCYERGFITTMCYERGFITYAVFDPVQPVQSAQAELGRNFLLSVNLMLAKGPPYLLF